MTGGLDGPRLLERLAALRRFGGAADGAVTRLAWGTADREAVGTVAGWAADAGATVHVDAVGNLVADLPGTAAGLPALATGSHLDTVVGAGALDGAYGVVAAVEMVAAVAEHPLRHPLRVAAFVNEEGVVAPPFTGSRAAAGVDVSGDLSHPGPDGTTLRDRMAAAGCAPDLVASAAWPTVAGYLELHIEQGPVLHAGGRRTGVVTAVVGQRRARVAWRGAANHAGTTPMAHRRDALVAAAEGVLAVRRLATEGLVDVATVGCLEVSPGAPNVVPGAVTFTVDIRSADEAALDAALARLDAELAAVAASTSTEVSTVVTSASAGAATDRRWQGWLTAACEAHGEAPLRLPSGAGHDAQHMAALGPVGMLFVPSVDGISHHRSERTDDADLVLGARIALDALRLADAALDA